MYQLTKKSLLLRLGIAMATITGFAFISMVSSVIIAELTQGVASAINQAGTLRMQSYRIASALLQERERGSHSMFSLHATDKLVDEFEARLVDARLVSVLSKNPKNELNTIYQYIAQQWYEKIKPLLLAPENSVLPRELFDASDGERDTVPSSSRKHTGYLAIVDLFVADIDHLVKLLEENAESKIRLLRLIQISSLFLTLIVVFITMYMMNNQVLVPLRDLLACAESARRGDFLVRAHYTKNDDELGQLGSAFNVMAEDLSKKYVYLEERVRAKTCDLERSNRSLELLYKTTNRLHTASISNTVYTELLRDIEKLLGVGAGTICLAADGKGRAFKLATTRQPSPGERDTCSPPDCAACFGSHDTHTMTFERKNKAPLPIVSTPIKDQHQQYGVLLTEVLPGQELEEWQMRSLKAVAGHIGIAINITRRATESRRLALLEERGVIARELHDSLAQSLSYLKIQVARLNAVLSRPDGKQEATPIINELRDGISRAYRQLRELLTTFRLKMDGPGLSIALEETIEEFRIRSGIAITLDNQLGGCQLNANEEIHILHIIREALANVTRHSRAERAEVKIRYDNDTGQITIRIDDNGIGINEEAERVDHYGLAIMNERASSLGGSIEISRCPGGGTRVNLVFTPHHPHYLKDMPQKSA